MKQLLPLLFIALFVCSCSEETTPTAPEVQEIVEEFSIDSISFQGFTLDTNQHYRGLTYNNQSFYFAGSGGAIGQISSAGEIEIKVDSSNGHYRDIHVDQPHGIYVMNITQPAYIMDASSKVFVDDDTLAFIDGFDFWDNGTALTYGDPTNGYPYVLKSSDKGRTWARISQEKLPELLSDEAGFAASGTGVVCLGDGTAYIGWGGEQARIFKTTDYGETWDTFNTPIIHGRAGLGIYCMAFKNEQKGVVAGGNWEAPEKADSTVAYTADGGVTWSLGTGGSGYRSGICHVKEEIYLSVGTKGTDISTDGGATWTQINDGNFNVVVASEDGSKAIALGSKGKGIIIHF